MKQFISFVRKEFYHIFRDARTTMILLLMHVILIIDRDQACADRYFRPKPG